MTTEVRCCQLHYRLSSRPHPPPTLLLLPPAISHPDGSHGRRRRGLPDFPARLDRGGQIFLGHRHLVQRLLLAVSTSREGPRVLGKGGQRVAGSSAPPLPVLAPRFEAGDGPPIRGELRGVVRVLAAELLLHHANHAYTTVPRLLCAIRRSSCFSLHRCLVWSLRQGQTRTRQPSSTYTIVQCFHRAREPGRLESQGFHASYHPVNDYTLNFRCMESKCHVSYLRTVL